MIQYFKLKHHGGRRKINQLQFAVKLPHLLGKFIAHFLRSHFGVGFISQKIELHQLFFPSHPFSCAFFSSLAITRENLRLNFHHFSSQRIKKKNISRMKKKRRRVKRFLQKSTYFEINHAPNVPTRTLYSICIWNIMALPVQIKLFWSEMTISLGYSLPVALTSNGEETTNCTQFRHF